MKALLLILLMLIMSRTSISQNNNTIGYFKYTVRTNLDSLIKNYNLTIINESNNDTLKFDSKTIEQPIKLENGSYEMICRSGLKSTHVTGVVINANHMTFYDFKLENDLPKSRKRLLQLYVFGPIFNSGNDCEIKLRAIYGYKIIDGQCVATLRKRLHNKRIQKKLNRLNGTNWEVNFEDDLKTCTHE
jgi:hypothetical protein